MKLEDIQIPRTCAEMQQAFEAYYQIFSRQMVRMNSNNINNYIKSYVDHLYEFSKSPPSTPNIIRAAMGVVTLHQFGYRDFQQLTGIFDRIIPQIDIEYVKFTSWCAGELIHHPDIDQDRYVVHLFRRLAGWSRAKGRRARPLAAAYLVPALANNAGVSCIGFMSTFLSVTYVLISYQSTQILQAATDAVFSFTRAIIRYKRGLLNEYLSYLEQLSEKILFFGSPLSEYAALKLYEQLIKGTPEHFLPKMVNLYNMINDTVADEPMIVTGAAFCTICSLSLVDPKLFIDEMAENIFSQISFIIYEFTKDTINSIALLCDTIPNFMVSKIDELKGYANDLVTEADSDFLLLTTLLDHFGKKCLPIDEKTINELLKSPKITEQYLNFFVKLANEEGFYEETSRLLCERVIAEMKTDSPIIALNLISQLPYNALYNKEELLEHVIALNRSESLYTRSSIPRAIFNLANKKDHISHLNAVIRLMQLGINDKSSYVRKSVLEVLRDKCCDILSLPEVIQNFQIFLNDDSVIVRQITFEIFAKLAEQNPLFVASYTRSAIQDAFFIIKHSPSIRETAKYTQTLPELVNASRSMIKVYSAGFMDICITLLTNPYPKLENFMDIDSYNMILIGVTDSLSLLAPLDPPQVYHYREIVIPLICDILLTNNKLDLSLSILKFFTNLLSAPSCTAQTSYREMTPIIFSACSKFLSETHSRHARMATLQTLGVIGVTELHHKTVPSVEKNPENVDDSLLRQFYHPSRDLEKKEIDESLLLKGNDSISQYFTSVAAASLLEIFQDDSMAEYYEETIQALVQVLKMPRMFMLGYFDTFISRLLDVIESTENFEYLQTLLSQFSILIVNSYHYASPFLERSLKFIQKRFCHELAPQCLDVILAFMNAMRDGYSPYAAETIYLLLGCLDDYKTTNEKLAIQVLAALEMLGVFTIDLLFLIIPSICKAVHFQQVLPKNVILASLEVLITLTEKVDMYPYLGPIIRALSSSIYHTNQTIRNTSYELLYTLIKTQGVYFIIGAIPLLESLKEANLETPYLQKLIKEAYEEAELGPKLFKPFVRDYQFQRYFKYAFPKLVSHSHPFSEDAIIRRIQTTNTGDARHTEQKMRSLILAVISNSPSEPIRSCINLATSHHPLALKLFNPAFLSCWNATSDHGRKDIAKSIIELFYAGGNYESMTRNLYDFIVFMDKIQRPMNLDPQKMVDTCMRYGGAAYALYMQSKLYYQNPTDVHILSSLIDIYIKIGDRSDVIGVWKKCQIKESSLNRVEILSKMMMWDKVVPVFEKVFKQTNDFESFSGMTQALHAMAMWPEIIGYYPDFEEFKSHQKREVSIFFSEAAIRTGRWDILEQTIQYVPEDSTRGCSLKALNAIHKGEWETVDNVLDKAFEILASRPVTFWTENQMIRPSTMKQAQELIEINEIKQYLKGEIEGSKIEEVWRERLKTAPRDFDIWFHFLANRGRFVDIKNSDLVPFFLLKGSSFGTNLHLNAFNQLFPGFDYDKAPDYQKVCFVASHWNGGMKTKAIFEMEKLSHEVSDEMKSVCHSLFASWLLQGEDNFTNLKLAFDHLKIIIKTPQGEDDKRIKDKEEYLKQFKEEEDYEYDLENDFSGECLESKEIIISKKDQKQKANPRYQELTVDLNSPAVVEKLSKATSNIDPLIYSLQIMEELNPNQYNITVLRRWSDVNYSLMSLDPENETEYVENAFEALMKISNLSPSFPDVVQLMNIFFEHANDEKIFNKATTTIKNLSPKLLIQASPQILIQLSHQMPAVSHFAHDTILSLLRDHFHDLIFSIIVMKKSSNKTRGDAAKKIINEFAVMHPKVYSEVELIRKSLLMAAVTWHERVLQLITEAFEHYQRRRIDRMITILSAIVKLVKKPKCEMHQAFLNVFGKSINQLDQILIKFNPKSKNSVSQIIQWCKQMQEVMSKKIKKIRMIQLSSISEELFKKTNFSLAVPGTYKPGKPVNYILYFVGQLSVYMSKQQPKDVLVRGENGVFYQYLLKGHEDLRLDERIMQFFRLINTLIVNSPVFKQNKISTTVVIPFSVRHGLVKWVPGTETLRSIVEQQRKLQNRRTMEEFFLMENYCSSSFDLMLPVQKMQIMKKIFNQVPDTDIANFFWLKAPNAETWLKQTINFAISSGITSIVGYVIGLGDRHPSNLLIDRYTGRVIHIDFGDCFEKAARRSTLPELVPFRLTRMMVRAMGPTGTEGNFISSFINMSQLLRENKRVLVMVLATFVHEPLINPDVEEDMKSSKGVSKIPVNNLPGKSFHSFEESKIQSSDEMRKRVIQKLTGNDFDDYEKLSVEDQASLLIETATDPYALSQMYSGWCPFW
ncbi:hypothetical protein M9Y10_034077 [Tritrichomonas musculus]|uniref:Serine/threonine-protein kinase TOR n=1 Tax=Tritrichomonas musculus TaxID=1915356 RepID=A0ABR2KDY8_9EUKA